MSTKSKPNEKYKTWGAVFDQFTQRTVYKLITEGHFEGLQSPLSIGKEANVFTAVRKDGTRLAAKIYRLETCDFNRMFDYIKDDPRFTKIRKGKRNIVFIWVQREFRNLLKAREAGVNVPTPITFSNNVLVLELIGDDDVAPKLKDKIPENPKEFLKKTVSNMKKLYDAKLIHSDLSPFNILNHNEIPVLIDFSQCITLESSRAEEFLSRDIKNVCNFFRKLGMNVDDQAIRKEITGGNTLKNKQ